MATVGQLNVDLSLDSASFVSDLGKAEGRINSFAAKSNVAMSRAIKGFNNFRGSINNVGKSLFSFQGIMGQVTGAAGLGLLISKSLAAADRIAKVADSVGFTTSQLQGYQFAASQSGIETEKFNKSLEVFAKNVGQAQLGTGEMVSKLKVLNPELLASVQAASSQDEAFRLVADAIKNAESATQAVTIATSAFGEAGIPMVNMLRGGSESLDEFSAKAQQMGLILDENLIRQAEEAGDKLAILGDVAMKKVTVELIKMAPQIIEVTQKLIDLIPVIISVADAFVSFFAKVGEGWQKVIDWLIVATVKTQQLLGLMNDDVAEGMLDQIGNQAKTATSEVDRLNQSLAKTPTALDHAVRASSKRAESLPDVFARGGMSRGPISGPMSKPTPVSSPSAISLKPKTVKASSVGIIATPSTSDPAQSWERVAKGMEKTQTQMDVLVSESTNAAGKIGEAFAENLLGIGDGWKSMRQVAVHALFDIGKAMAQNFVNNMGWTQGMGGGSMSSAGGSGGFGDMLGGAGTMEFANGGVINRRTHFNFAGGNGMMGEAGPEAILPLKRVNGKLGVASEGGGAGNVIINMTVVTPDVQSFRKNQPQIMADTRMAMERTARRNS